MVNLYSLLFIISEINDGWILVPKKEVNKRYIIWPKVFLENKAAKPVREKKSSAHIAPLS